MSFERDPEQLRTGTWPYHFIERWDFEIQGLRTKSIKVNWAQTLATQCCVGWRRRGQGATGEHVGRVSPRSSVHC